MTMAPVTPPNPLPPDENVNPTLLAISGVLIFFVIFTTTLRLYVRFSLRHLGWDDYLMAITASLGIVRYGVQCAQGATGNGRHRWYISSEEYVNNNMLGWFGQILLFASVCLLKCSIMLLLLRIKDSSRMKYFLWTVMGGLVITNFGVIIILLAECDPVEAYWTGVGKCWDAKIRIYAIYLTICELTYLKALPGLWLTLNSLFCFDRLALLIPASGGRLASPNSLDNEDFCWWTDESWTDVRISSHTAI